MLTMQTDSFSCVRSQTRFALLDEPAVAPDRMTAWFAAVFGLVVICVTEIPVHAAQPRPMVELRAGTQLLEGAVLQRSATTIEVLGRDGKIWDFKPDQIQRWRDLPLSFRAASAMEIRSSLERDLDGRLDVSTSGHFIVACPKGQSSRWVERFESLLRSFRHYFAVRGLDPQDPQFPLIAVVWPNQHEFLVAARDEGTRLSSSVLGYYSLKTNRVSLFDSTTHGGGDWGQNASVIIHEATHQSAFNCGVHNRFSPPPRWLAEGLGMLFEACGVYDSRRYGDFSDRINRGRLQQFRTFVAKGRHPQTWLQLVKSDVGFSRNVGAAYAESWAFSFFLVESYPAKYCAYLKRTAARPDFVTVTEADRLADFKAVFGDDFVMLEASFVRFIAGIK